MLASDEGESGTNIQALNANSLIFNGGPKLTNCIDITGTAGGADWNHFDGRDDADHCTNVINNAVNTYTYTTAGSIDYTWASQGAGPIKQTTALLNGFGPGGAGLYYSAGGTAIPACSATYARYFSCVSDSTACTSGTTYTSGGSTACLLQCNNAGNAWKETGTLCF